MEFAQLIGPTGPWNKIWLAVHWDRKLKKQDYDELDLRQVVREFLQKRSIISLRATGHLLLGATKFYAKKILAFEEEAKEVQTQIMLAFNAEEEAKKAGDAIDGALIAVDGMDISAEASDKAGQLGGKRHVARLEDITMRQPDQLSSPKAPGGEDLFGAATSEELKLLAQLRASLFPPAEGASDNDTPLPLQDTGPLEAPRPLPSGAAPKTRANPYDELDNVLLGLDDGAGAPPMPLDIDFGLFGDADAALRPLEVPMSPIPTPPPMDEDEFGALAAASDGEAAAPEADELPEGVPLMDALAADAGPEVVPQQLVAADLADQLDAADQVADVSVDPPAAAIVEGDAAGAAIVEGDAAGAAIVEGDAAGAAIVEGDAPLAKKRRRGFIFDERTEIAKETYQGYVNDRSAITRRTLMDYAILLPHYSPNLPNFTTTYTDICPSLAQGLLQGLAIASKRRLAASEAADDAAQRHAKALRTAEAAAADDEETGAREDHVLLPPLPPLPSPAASPAGAAFSPFPGFIPSPVAPGTGGLVSPDEVLLSPMAPPTGYVERLLPMAPPTEKDLLENAPESMGAVITGDMDAEDQTANQTARTGYSGRTEKMHRFLAKEFTQSEESSSQSLSYTGMCQSQASGRRELIAGCFFELLVLKTNGVIGLQQDKPYADINILKSKQWS